MANFEARSISGSCYKPLLLLEAACRNQVHQPVDIGGHFGEIWFKGIWCRQTLGWIPVEVTSKKFQISVLVGGKYQKCTVHRRQFPITVAYSFTDYRSQGQTIPYVLVDIAQPPTGTLSLFNLYVALGARDGIAFDFSGILTKGHFQRSHRRQAGKIRLNYKDWWTRMRGPQVGSD